MVHAGRSSNADGMAFAAQGKGAGRFRSRIIRQCLNRLMALLFFGRAREARQRTSSLPPVMRRHFGKAIEI
jgi:hypothetical protein